MDTQTLNVGWMVCSFALLAVVLGQWHIIRRLSAAMDDASMAMKTVRAALRGLYNGSAQFVSTGPGPDDYVVRLKEEE